MAPRPRKTRPRQTHQVNADLRVRDITKAGSFLTLKVYGKGRKLGSLTVGSGSITWKRGRRKAQKYSWTKFAKLMEDLQ